MKELKSKKSQLIELLQRGAIKEALKIAKTFVKEFDKEQNRTITRAHEMTHSPEFYVSLGFNAQTEFEKAEKIMLEKYDHILNK